LERRPWVALALSSRRNKKSKEIKVEAGPNFLERAKMLHQDQTRLTRLARVGALALAKDGERISAYMIGETRGKA
jgi:hypothetical protein